MGGVERAFVTLANELVKHHYRVTFIVCREEGIFLSKIASEIKIVNFGGIHLKFAFVKLTRYLYAETPDYLISGPDFPNIVAIISSKLSCCKTKVIVTQHNYFNISIKKIGLKGKILPWLVKQFYPYAFKIVAVSDGIVHFLYSLNLSKEKIVKIYNPIDINTIREAAKKVDDLDIPNDFILFLGRLDIVKNIPLLINAFKKLLLDYPELSLVIVGAGEEEKKLKRLIKELELSEHVFMKGLLSNPFGILRKARLLVLPSFSESFGNVLVEAMTLGVTSVSTPNAGACEILQNGKLGYLTTTFDNSEEFAIKLKQGILQPFSTSILELAAEQYAANSIVMEFKDILN